MALHHPVTRIQIGGIPVGGINFYVDVAKVKPGSFYWNSSPAVAAPLEFTMKLVDYKELGDTKSIRPLEEVLRKIKDVH